MVYSFAIEQHKALGCNNIEFVFFANNLLYIKKDYMFTNINLDQLTEWMLPELKLIKQN